MYTKAAHQNRLPWKPPHTATASRSSRRCLDVLISGHLDRFSSRLDGNAARVEQIEQENLLKRIRHSARLLADDAASADDDDDGMSIMQSITVLSIIVFSPSGDNLWPRGSERRLDERVPQIIAPFCIRRQMR